MKPRHKGIIFDLDGTLVDTLGDIAATMNRSLELHGFQALPVEEYRGKVGWGIIRLAQLALPPDARGGEMPALVAADAAKFYAEAPLVHSKAYPGIPELIAALGLRKIKTAVLSNKPDPAAQKVIAGLFPQGSFSAVQGEMPGKARKPDPACVWEILFMMDLTPASVIFAGDSEIDMETAAASGCFPLGVSWGYRSADTIFAAGARNMINRPEELLELL